MADLLRFFVFYVTIFTLWRDRFKSFSCILLKFVMHVFNNQFSDKINNGRHFYLVSGINLKVIHAYSSDLLCMLRMLLITSFRTSSIMEAGYCRVRFCFLNILRWIALFKLEYYLICLSKMSANCLPIYPTCTQVLLWQSTFNYGEWRHLYFSS